MYKKYLLPIKNPQINRSLIRDSLKKSDRETKFVHISAKDELYKTQLKYLLRSNNRAHAISGKLNTEEKTNRLQIQNFQKMKN